MNSDFVTFFGKHLVALYVTLGPEDKELPAPSEIQRKVYSGTLIRIEGILFLLTAGHCLEDVKRAASNGLRIISSEIIDTFGEKVTCKVAIPFTLETDKFLYINDDHAGLDFGLIYINNYFEQQLHKNGITAVEEVNWKHQSTMSFDFYAMLGLPEEGCNFSDSGSTQLETTMLFLDEHPSPPQKIRETKFPRFIGKFIDLQDINSLVGMSGGPILGFRRDPVLKYWVVGIQSGWWENKNLVFGTKITTIAKLLTDFLHVDAA